MHKCQKTKNGRVCILHLQNIRVSMCAYVCVPPHSAIQENEQSAVLFLMPNGFTVCVL
jgi:hypothetical protein